MANKETIAVIGADSENARLVVTRLVGTARNILLMDPNVAKLEAFFQSLCSMPAIATIEIINCSREASWEADMIILSAEVEDAIAVLQKISDVARNKVVIILSGNDDQPFGSLPDALPYSKIVVLQMYQEINVDHFTVLIESTDCEAATSVAALFESIGLITTTHSLQ
ncbi:NAD(P)-binding domain-containing protein [Flavisolibacter ginsengisoli]|jgi:predicted dinucleotide-binding enzyme|uniref:Pyrroline-5-carboxylate reductase catalytic N-terminal domain-containing protein n=1 Tax=Flavisolibacter ginsengisoli DSM 18119 TaxID=1121884 RepID=A0A1M5G729_9BACT|nr:NAD(P)-binding domain-containing protein [Flavisolibacter ginsengisoli]SHF99498.1 hypothetical protein SAMN02745131_04068 [Flavisolibacter ginsengisoli DSM 18119]